MNEAAASSCGFASEYEDESCYNCHFLQYDDVTEGAHLQT